MPKRYRTGNYPQSDLYAFHGNNDSLTGAIDAVQQSTGGKVVEIRFAQQNGKPGYHTVVAQNGQVQFGRIEPPSKNVTELTTRPDWMLKWGQKTDVQLATKAKVSLSQAVHTAESQIGAPALAAGMARSASDPNSDVHAYNVLLDNNGSIERVAVDSATGEMISDPGQLGSWP
jgi:uncharacterized membrane protein YkoI